MPRLFGDSILRATDSDDEPVPGALLTVYEAGTTTEVPTYSDADLSIAQSVPVVASSAGVFPPVYVPPGTYKLGVTTASGAAISGYPVDNVVAGVGITSVISKDFDNRAAAQAATIASDVGAVRLLGYTTAGDGETAQYKRAASSPGHAGSFQDAEDNWWEIANAKVQVEQLGAVADGATNARGALQSALSFRSEVGLTGSYAISGAVDVSAAGYFRRIIGQGQTFIQMLDAAATFAFGETAAAYGCEIGHVRIEGNDVALVPLRMAEISFSHHVLVHDTMIRGYVDFGIKVEGNNDGSRFERVIIENAPSSHSGSAAFRHLEVGPISGINCTFANCNGWSYWGDYQANWTDCRFTFGVQGLIKFTPTKPTRVLSIRGPYIENVGFRSGAGVPTGSPIGILADGGDIYPNGGIVIDSPQKFYAGWASDLIVARDGAWIHYITGSVPIDGNTVPFTPASPPDPQSGRQLQLFSVLGIDSGSFLRIEGPLKTNFYHVTDNPDGSYADFIGRFQPQSQGYPLRVGGNGHKRVWAGDMTTTTGWTSSNLSSFTSVSGRLRAVCDGTGCNVFQTAAISKADSECLVGKIIVLQMTATPKGAGPFNLNCGLQGAGLSKMTTASSWTEEAGSGSRTYHSFVAYVESDEDIRVNLRPNDSGSEASTSEVDIHEAEIWVLDA
ncbi:carboxypeptidase-like regulatory domain-containing protein [Albimonas pacifica]|uniref:Uncharacterized protein n=1 Tax=Albimonas pacifica TaxID=1114924 RepID=A0A1I3LJ29_9RHOB|nr:carboxypeptidase-like regulatory domain-containing protein [Albimonas pacifica]SFI84723.1 hypothetical protein SAMN05216258_11053 [Albimonas pacifica]